jgi:hypothetical protein
VARTTKGRAVCSYIDWGPITESSGPFRYAWALPCNSTDQKTAAAQDGWNFVSEVGYYTITFTDNSDPRRPFVGCLDRSSIGVNQNQVTVAPCTQQVGQRWLKNPTTIQGGPADTFLITAVDNPNLCLDLWHWDGPQVNTGLFILVLCTPRV